MSNYNGNYPFPDPNGRPQHQQQQQYQQQPYQQQRADSQGNIRQPYPQMTQAPPPQNVVYPQQSPPMNNPAYRRSPSGSQGGSSSQMSIPQSASGNTTSQSLPSMGHLAAAQQPGNYGANQGVGSSPLPPRRSVPNTQQQAMPQPSNAAYRASYSPQPQRQYGSLSAGQSSSNPMMRPPSPRPTTPLMAGIQQQPMIHSPSPRPVYANTPPQQYMMPNPYQQLNIHPAYYYANIRPVYIHQYMFDINQGAALVKKEIPLTKDGNLVVEIPLSSEVLKDARYKSGKEFTHVRYTAVTCEPNDMGTIYTLRQKESGRKTKIALVCTMYNEDEVLFCKSLKAVFKNVKQFCDYYGADWWQHFVVVIVSDGRAKINPRTLTVLGAMGCYADGLMQTSVNDKPVNAHLFEYTPQVVCSHDGEIITAKDDICPVQTIFLLKEKNAKKINSHRWFFNGICKILDPEVCMLLDVGTKPTPRSFLELWKAFERNSHVGGACGEIAAELGKGCGNLLNPLVAAQNFEYKMSNILDKPLESVFGFISVLPGAFSAYRFRAIEGAPLDAYFFGEALHGGADVYKANMYLAEDRILCFEIVAKRGESWVLKYVKNAKAETDVPDRLPELISQRRRWLNGSFFAAVHAILNWTKIFRSSHSFFRKLLLLFQFFYNLISLIFNWFSVANFYLAFYFLFDVSDSAIDPSLNPFGTAGPIVAQVLKSIYIFLLMATVIMGMGNRPQGSKTLYHIIVVFFAIIMVLIVFLSIWTVVISMQGFGSSGKSFITYIGQTPAFRDVLIALGTTYGAYAVSSILHFDPWHILTSMLQYMLLLPSYVNILMIYAFCNIHDISWGTKGDNVITTGEGAKVKTTDSGEKVAEVSLPSMDSKDVDVAYQNILTQFKKNALNKEKVENKRDAKTKQDDYFRQFRTNVVLFWATTNAVLVYVITSDKIMGIIFAGKTATNVNPYLTFLFWTVATLSIIRFFFSTLYILGHWKNKIRYLGK